MSHSMNHNHIIRALCAFSVILWSASSSHAADKKPVAKKKITYTEHILPLFKDKCISCHSQDKKRGGLNLSNYTSLIAGGSSGVCVKPGDAESSLLYKSMAHIAEPYMPPRSPKLPKDKIELVRQWIAGGAPENAGSKVVIPDKPKVDFTLPRIVKGKPAGAPPMPPATLSKTPVVRAARDTTITALASSPWAPLLAVGGQKQVLLYHSDSLELLGILPFPEGTPQVLKFSRNASLLLCGGGHAGKSGKVVVWSVTTGKRLTTIGDETDCVLAADISPDQSRVALGGPGKVVRIFNTKDGSLAHTIKKHTDWVTALEYSPDGVLLASGDRSGGLYVWEAHTAREYHTLKGHTNSITAVSWRSDSNAVASCSEDATVRLYEMENGNQFRGWGANGGGVLSVRFAHENMLVSCGRDKLTRHWDGNGGAKRTFEAMSDVVTRVTFTHDGKRVVAGDNAGQIVVWNTADGKRVGTLSANPASIADQIASAKKIVEVKQKAYDSMNAIATASKSALDKATAAQTVGQKLVTDTAATLKTADAKLTIAKNAATTARTGLNNANAEVKAKQTLSAALADAVAKVKTEADKDKTNTSLSKALTRVQTMSGLASAELVLAQANQTEMEKAVRKLDPILITAQQEQVKAQAAATAATKNLPGLQAAVKAAQTKAATDRAAADKALVELNQAKAALAKLQPVPVVKKGK